MRFCKHSLLSNNDCFLLTMPSSTKMASLCESFSNYVPVQTWFFSDPELINQFTVPTAQSADQAWGEYFIKYSNTNTFEKYEYEYEYEYTNFKSIRIRIWILFQKVFEYIYEYITNTFLFEYINFKFCLYIYCFLMLKYI